MDKQAWTLHIDDEWIAWLTFDLPGEKVNKFTATALRQLDAHLDDLAVNEEIKAVAIRSAKRDSFIVGADIGELALIGTTEDALEKAETGHAVFDKLAALPVPTIAVIHGACMGGGLEMALACDHRLVTDHPKTSLGTPEVNLGILPGWGGTQRLPRLVGVTAGLTMILAGRPVSARRARRMALADGVVTEAFQAAQTQAFVNRILTRRGRRDVQRRRRLARPRLVRFLESNPLGRLVIYTSARRNVLKKTRGQYPAPLDALRVVRRTYRRRVDGGAVERAAFADLAVSSISGNLVWLFQASQRMKKGTAATAGDDRVFAMDSAGVVGAGIMGGGIAWALSRAGLRVRMKDIDWDAAARGMAAAAGMYSALVKRRKMTEGEMNLAMHRIAPTVDYAGFRDMDVVIEAVVEDLEIKQQVLRDLEDHVSSDTVICTNTSSLPLKSLASVLSDPRRFAGLHFFNPVDRMQLVEIVAGRKTSEQTVAALTDLVKRMGKLPVVVGDCPGFLVNRILLPYLIESTWMFEEGVDAPRLDGVLEAFGMPMGPLALVDEVGIDVGYKVAKVLESAYGPRMSVAALLGDVVDTNTLHGKKSGRGFYLYNSGHRKPNPEVEDLVPGARERDGIRPRPLSDDDIVDRAILIMVNEAARCLDERVVDGPETLDMAMVMGTGFAPFRGGLLRYADARGVDRIRDRLNELADAHGDRFRPVPLIERLAGNGNHFYPTNGS